MPQLTPELWIVVAGVASATAWLVGRLSGKVDWKIYQQDRKELQDHIVELKVSVEALLERSKSQEKLIERYMNCKLTPKAIA